MTDLHNFSGWPGAFCLDCGCEDPVELEEAAGLTIPDDHPGKLPCKHKGKGLCNPYKRKPLTSDGECKRNEGSDEKPK